MKRTLLLIAAGLIMVAGTSAQKAELTGFYGISLNSKVRSYFGTYQVDNKPNYGGMLSFALSSQVFVELMYNRTDTRIRYYNPYNPVQPYDISIEYYQVGGLQEFNIGPDMILPFGAFSLGLTRFNLKQPIDFENTGTPIYVKDEYLFSVTAGAGVKILLHERVGIRLQARLGAPMAFNGLWIGVGTGGASGGASFRVPVIMLDLSAGLILRI